MKLALTRHASVFALAAAAIFAMPTVASAADAAQVEFAIPAKAMAEALSDFSRATGLQVAARPEDLRGRKSQPVNGRFTPEQALSRLTAGAGVTARISGGAVLIQPNATPAATPVRSTSAAPALGAAATPISPSAEANTVADLVVMGFRGSLMQARDIKRMAVGAQDSIVADDIAAFPDLNLAEALQRVPGVAITRDAGEGRQIALRGLGPDFTRAQLNGMEVLGNTSSGFDNRGSVSRTRSFDYSLFASELFNRVTVEKSYAAEQDEGGIGGTVGLTTARPFDYQGFRGVLGAKAQKNSNTEDVTPRVVGLISNRWDSSIGEFGALFSVAYSENDVNEYGYRSWNWTKINVNAANIGPGVSAADAARLSTATGMNRLSAPQAPSYSTWFAHRERLGLTGALQWRPTDRIEMSLDLLYGTLSNERDEFALAPAGVNALTGNVTGTQRLNAVEIRGDSIVYADWSGVDMRNEAKHSNDETTFTQAVYNASFQATDNLSFTALLGHARSEFEGPVFDKVFIQANNKAFSYDFRNGSPATNTYGFDVTDPSQWSLMRADAREDYILSEYTTAMVDAAWRFAPHSTLKVGVQHKDFANEGWQRFQRVDWYNRPNPPAPVLEVMSYDSIAPYVVADVDATYDRTGQLRDLTSANDQPGTNFQISEKTTSAYVQYDLDTVVGDFPVRANAGVRYYSTDLTSAGSVNTNAGLVPAVIETSYDGFLPAANIVVDVTPDLVARLGVNRNISRPSLGDLRAAGSVSFTPFGGSVNAGNPNLKPFLADSVEASVEYYMGASGYVALGVFYKSMDSFITAETASVPYGTIGYPLSLQGPGQDANTIYSFSRPVNGDGATIKGAEFAIQRDLDFLPAPFDKLGFIGNVTYAEGETDATVDGVVYKMSLANLSKWTTNATLYYETERWGARVSSAYRDGYRDGIGGNGNVGSGYHDTHNVDVAAHYNVSPALKLVFEGINITDEPIDQYTDLEAQRPTSYTTSGRTFTLGVSYVF
ncbi:TonB-dependent receptor [Phenylobacterium sp.]|uniref:TonB-dependent receptor n=1 Tax=Phenylobacterium sp. TaxID=1871053 RepID=UPI00272F9FE0|nr:TonB-dependent receptor [Phenylobacterium sp.]MDP1618666.1 TonB-dependent receptor [Phenylobacterium sp.]MDP1986571.1 TonB-dependent receptor [Phenylobacterium sp.]